MKKYFYILAIVALGITACNNKEYLDPNEKLEEIVPEAQVYHFCIPASLDEDADTKAMSFDNSGVTPTSTSTFSTLEVVYVYNNNKGALLDGTLRPTNLSNGDKNCDLAGDLTGDIDPGDVLTLYYNSDNYGFGPIYPYNTQNGSASGVLDGATATVTVSSTSPSLSTTSAHFSKFASMFRFKFKDETEAPIEVRALTACSKNGSIIGQHMPLANPAQQYILGNLPIQIASPTIDYLYLSLFFDESRSNSSDALTFIADDGTYLYLGDKTAPTGGFKNKKYYYNTTAIQLTKVGALQAPTITWTNPSVAQYPDPQSHEYTVNDDGIDISLTGTSLGYCFFMLESSTSTITLNSLTATKYDNPFIDEVQGSLTLNISGDNIIDSRFIDCSIFTVQTLKLQGSGTLTVTTNSSEFCGLRAINNYNPTNNDNATTDAHDVSTQLAADGYTVTRSARTDNADGTYTWTYTVASAGPSQTKSINASDVEVPAGKHWLITGTGSVASNFITIGDGATVTLDGVKINMGDEDIPCIKCEGSATIILKDGSTNQLVSNNSNYPALLIGDEGTTLTIQGSTGTLTVTSGAYCAGIGGGYSNNDHTCGNIVIEGGVIDATGGTGGAGIGSDNQGICGSITISGGTVTATATGNNGNGGAGIGSGYGSSSCGNIIISGGTVIAECSNAGGAGIGSGKWSSCGNISISGGHITATGGDYAAGIGGGDGYNGVPGYSSCGNITIENTVTSVTATKGNYGYPESIGAGDCGICGTVSIAAGANVTQN